MTHIAGDRKGRPYIHAGTVPQFVIYNFEFIIIMLTYDLKKSPGVPLYEALYRCIRADILSGVLAPGAKLPSKRALALNLEVSKITVEAAYAQLLAEGYIRSTEKVGCFVEAVERHAVPPVTPAPVPVETAPLLDLTGSAPRQFPFPVWSRLLREVMLDYGESLLLQSPNTGIAELRRAIAEHLSAFRGMQVDENCILIGAGTDFLYNLLIQLLGRDKCYAVEEPGYGKIRRIYAAAGATCIGAGLDENGVRPDSLKNAQVLHCSPSHHFPTGLVTPVGRRLELLRWAEEGSRYIIEDDYDCEFRFDAHPMPALQSLDHSGRVIYMNTFSKSLAPSIRISYMVLPRPLMEKFQKDLGFYSCTVPSFEQYTLARFLSRGYFEKHINRLRRSYKGLRNRVIEVLENSPLSDQFTIEERDAGLHFLLRIDTKLSDEALAERCAASGIRVYPLSHYYHSPVPASGRHCLVINYAGLSEADIALLEEKLQNI